jgi:hypothetical protein
MNNNVARVDEIIAGIKRSMTRPGWRLLTPRQMRQREDTRRHMANLIALQEGWGGVRPEYQPVEREEEDF